MNDCYKSLDAKPRILAIFDEFVLEMRRIQVVASRSRQKHGTRPLDSVLGTSRAYHLPVDRKGFRDEDYTIASDTVMAYFDIGEIKDIKDFPGLKRDGEVPAGDRIYQLPYLDPKGRMTICQWNTASFATDYRLAPLRAAVETFTWKLPADTPPGPVTVTATIYYSRLVSSVAQFLKDPEEEYAPVTVNSHQTVFSVLD